MITYNNEDILKSFIGNKRVVRKYLNNKIVYGIPDFAQYYNIQGYDNYEVVGNLTIVNGVASGFSNRNYLTLTTIPQGSSIEFNFRFTPTETLSGSFFRLGASAYRGVLEWAPNNTSRMRFSYREIGSATTVYKYFNALLNVPINYNMVFNSSTNTLVSTITSNNTTQVITVENVDGAEFTSTAMLGYVGSNRASLNGTIDLNNTYIKVNENYWFNGNPNYKELLDCNPNVYLKNTNTSYVDTNYLPSKYTRIKFNFKIDNVREISPNTRNWIMGANSVYKEMNNFYVGFWQRTDTSAAFWANSTNLSGGQYINYVWELNNKYFVDFKGSSAVANDSYTDLYDENGNRKFHILNSNTDDIDMLGKTLLLFIKEYNVNSQNMYFLGSLYPMQIYERDVLKMNLVPVPQGLQIGSYKVPSNGMFDIVEQKFYENKGSGEFIWGVDL